MESLRICKSSNASECKWRGTTHQLQLSDRTTALEMIFTCDGSFELDSDALVDLTELELELEIRIRESEIQTRVLILQTKERENQIRKCQWNCPRPDTIST